MWNRNSSESEHVDRGAVCECLHHVNIQRSSQIPLAMLCYHVVYGQDQPPRMTSSKYFEDGMWTRQITFGNNPRASSSCGFDIVMFVVLAVWIALSWTDLTTSRLCASLASSTSTSTSWVPDDSSSAWGRPFVSSSRSSCSKGVSSSFSLPSSRVMICSEPPALLGSSSVFTRRHFQPRLATLTCFFRFGWW